MAKQNLNSKSSEYIEQNFLAEHPEGLEARSTVPEEGAIVVSSHMPKFRTIQFINGRDPGQELMFHYHSKTHPLKHYTLFHGKEYTLSEEVIEHLESCCYTIYAYRTSPDSGQPEMYPSSKKYLYQCRNVKQRAA